jgi:hypothetical protein
MKNLKSQFIGCALITMFTALTTGCTKPPDFKADPNNAYVTGVPNPPPTGGGQALINSITPSAALPSTVVVIAGNNFNTAISGNTVTVNGVPATIYGVSSTYVVFTVPANATTGKVVLTSGANVVTSISDFIVKSGTVSSFANLGANNMQHIAFDADGNLYGDNLNKILKISAGGVVSTYPVGAPAGTFGSIWGIAISRDREIFVPDRLKHSIIKVAADGLITALAGNGVEEYLNAQGSFARFVTPTGIALDAGGNLYVNDTYRVRRISSTAVVTTLAGGTTDGIADGIGSAARFGSLEGIAIDASGNIYVSDTKYLRIRKITPEGEVTTFAGSGTAGFADGPAATAQFTHPTSLAFDLAGNLFIADSNPLLPFYTIRMVNKLGVVSTLLKGTSNSGVINGPIATASVNQPEGMAFDPAGNLYISNTGANVISKVTFQ